MNKKGMATSTIIYMLIIIFAGLVFSTVTISAINVKSSNAILVKVKELLGDVETPIDSGPWLSNYTYRMRLTVDSSLIDEDLTHFPLTVHLNTANGTDAIFNEVGVNNKKIAFTMDDAVTELFAEIENGMIQLKLQLFMYQETTL